MIKKLLEDIENGFKVQKAVAQRNFLKKCRTLKICPPEIRSLAERLTSNRSKKENLEEEDNIMKKRIWSTTKTIESLIRNWTKTTIMIRETNAINKEIKIGFGQVKVIEIDRIKRIVQ